MTMEDARFSRRLVSSTACLVLVSPAILLLLVFVAEPFVLSLVGHENLIYFEFLDTRITSNNGRPCVARVSSGDGNPVVANADIGDTAGIRLDAAKIYLFSHSGERIAPCLGRD